MFEAKSYNDVRQTLATGNGIFAAAFLIIGYFFVLSPGHRTYLDTFVSQLKVNPMAGSLITLAVIGGVWGYVTTGLFSLHDRLYEPHLVSWRAAYDADLILRSLCFSYAGHVSARFFDVAFNDPKACGTFMQRLFYKFVGDSKPAHEELRERFYGLIRNYWLLVTAEMYCFGFFFAGAIYSIRSKAAVSPYHDCALLFSILAAVIFRISSNQYLRRVRPITLEQINSIIHEHGEAFEAALDEVAREYHLQP